METNATLELIFKWIAGIAAALMFLFLLFGTFRGYYMERQHQIRKYGRRKYQH